MPRLPRLSRLILYLGMMGLLPLQAQISYQASYHPQAGNPGGLNQEQDYNSSGWTVVMLGGFGSNRWSTATSLPFSFHFFGQDFNHFRVSANGLLTFGSGTAGLLGDNLSLPTGGLPSYTIACFWDQFTTEPPLPLNDAVQIKTFGTAPNRQCWIRWASYEWASANFVYLAIVLEEATGNIYLVDQYSSPSSTTLQTTVGLQKTGGFAVQVGTQVSLTGATSAAFDNSYYRFEPYTLPPEDIVPLEVVAPRPSACGTSAEPVAVRISNQGQLDARFIEVGYSLDGVVQASEVIPGPLAPGHSITYTFSQWLNYPGPGEYELEVWGSTANDADAANDSLRRDLRRVSQIGTFPYVEDFENGNGGWYSGGSNSSWVRAVPLKDRIRGAASGNLAWVTGQLEPHQAFENSYVVSPCFDFRGLGPRAQLSMWVWWESESPWDGAAVQSSVDGGQTWQAMGQVGPDWYNSIYVASLPGGQPLGWSGRYRSGDGSSGWRQVSHPIPLHLRGQPEVRLRVVFASDGANQSDGFAFDRVVIGDPPAVDLGPDGYYCPGHVLDAGNPSLAHQWSTGAQRQTLTLQNPGRSAIQDSLVTVTVTDALGISTTDTLIWSMAVPMQAEASEVQPSRCHGAADGQIVTQVQGGTPPYQYQWSHGAQRANPTGLAAGQYQAEVQDLHGCTTEIDPVEVPQPVPLDFAAAITDVKCHGDSKGRIALTAEGGNGGYRWEWKDGSTQATRSDLPAGSYPVVLRDSNGCQLVDTLFVRQPDPMGVRLVDRVDPSCPGADDGRLEVRIEGGRAPHRLLWSDGSQGPVVDRLPAAVYWVTVRDSAHCQVQSEAWKLTPQDSAPQAHFGYQLDLDRLSVQDSSRSAHSYAWDFGDGTSSSQPAPIHDYGATGRFEVTLVVANRCGRDTARQAVEVTAVDTTRRDSNTTALIDEPLTDADWQLYPNPNAGTFRLRVPAPWSSEPLTIQVYGLSGQLVQEVHWPVGKNNGLIRLDEGFSEGFYQIWVRNSKIGYGKAMLLRY